MVDARPPSRQFVDWADGLVMVPVVNGVDREVIAEAIRTYWPTIDTILWPEDLDVKTIVRG